MSKGFEGVVYYDIPRKLKLSFIKMKNIMITKT